MFPCIAWLAFPDLSDHCEIGNPFDGVAPVPRISLPSYQPLRPVTDLGVKNDIFIVGVVITAH